MGRIKSILFYVEGDLNHAALDRAVEVAQTVDAKLTLAAVIKPARSQVLLTRDSFDLDEVERLLVEDRQRQLDEAAGGACNRGIDAATRVFVGDPVGVIIEAVQNGRFDLLVKEPTPSHGLRQQLFGSTDMRLMRACPCPVLIAHVKRDGYSGRAVVAVDYDAGDERKASLNRTILDSAATALATGMANVREVHVVHAYSLYGDSLLSSGRGKLSPEGYREAFAQEEERKEQWLGDLVDDFRKKLDETRAASFSPRPSLVHGDPLLAIPRKVKEVDADLLAMGTVSRGGVAGLMIGNTAESILSCVDCSVVVHKPEGFVVSGKTR